MISLLVLSLLAVPAEDSAPEPWTEVRLTVFRDPYSSSDSATTCRVRADNSGARSWPGHGLVFEVRAVGAERGARARGRFGLTLEPYGHLETLVVVPGRHDRFEVVPVRPHDRTEHESSPRRRTGRHRKPASRASQ